MLDTLEALGKEGMLVAAKSAYDEFLKSVEKAAYNANYDNYDRFNELLKNFADEIMEVGGKG